MGETRGLCRRGEYKVVAWAGRRQTHALADRDRWLSVHSPGTRGAQSPTTPSTILTLKYMDEGLTTLIRYKPGSSGRQQRPGKAENGKRKACCRNFGSHPTTSAHRALYLSFSINYLHFRSSAPPTMSTSYDKVVKLACKPKAAPPKPKVCW